MRTKFYLEMMHLHMPFHEQFIYETPVAVEKNFNPFQIFFSITACISWLPLFFQKELDFFFV